MAGIAIGFAIAAYILTHTHPLYQTLRWFHYLAAKLESNHMPRNGIGNATCDQGTTVG